MFLFPTMDNCSHQVHSPLKHGRINQIGPIQQDGKQLPVILKQEDIVYSFITIPFTLTFTETDFTLIQMQISHS